MTPLDKVFAAVLEGKKRIDDFYALFLNTDIHIPTNKPEGSQEGEEFVPLVVKNEGITFLPIFDRYERLKDWAGGKDIAHVQMSAHALIHSSLDPKIHLFLNPGNEYSKEFMSDELAWLRGHFESRRPTRVKIPAGTKVTVREPEKIPEAWRTPLQDV